MNITIKDFQKRIPISPTRIKKVILNILSCEGVKKSGAITLCFTDNKKIKELNKKHLGRNAPTDVLAFDFNKDKNSFFADIVISTDTAISNAKIFKTAPLYEMYLYVIHGILHILGYDDKNAKQRRIMRNKEREFLRYADTKNRSNSFKPPRFSRNLPDN